LNYRNVNIQNICRENTWQEPCFSKTNYRKRQHTIFTFTCCLI